MQPLARRGLGFLRTRLRFQHSDWNFDSPSILEMQTIRASPPALSRSLASLSISDIASFSYRPKMASRVCDRCGREQLVDQFVNQRDASRFVARCLSCRRAADGRVTIHAILPRYLANHMVYIRDYKRTRTWRSCARLLAASAFHLPPNLRLNKNPGPPTIPHLCSRILFLNAETSHMVF